MSKLDNLITALTKQASDMTANSELMLDYGGESAEHAKELQGAATITEQWIDSLKEGRQESREEAL